MYLWDKGGAPRESLISFTCDSDRVYDARLAPYDIVGSMAHAVMLEKCGLITAGERECLLAGLARLMEESLQPGFSIGKEYEDNHSWVEIRLGEMAAEEGKLDAGHPGNAMTDEAAGKQHAGHPGNAIADEAAGKQHAGHPANQIAVEAARKLHTGRSRNDQVLTDLHLYIRHQSCLLAHELQSLADTFLVLSEKHSDDLMPGFTHMQAAMVTSFGLWFASYAESLCDDLHVLAGAAVLADASPLGTAAGYGTSLPIDRELTASLLGFQRLMVASPYAQMSRGRTERQVTDAIASAANTIGRFASDVILFMSPGYGFISLSDDLTTGSSIMPQKRNPDLFELIRARCNRLQAVPGEVVLVTSGLPPGYNRDYQELKATLFDAFDGISELARAVRVALEGLVIRNDIMSDSRYNDIFSVEEANAMVREGVPFRDAYREVAGKAGSGLFTAPKKTDYTHMGSIGNVGQEIIRERLGKITEGFGKGYSPQELFDRITGWGT
ncbi:MAG: argininosuccinate lyase [Bacteroidales bacterium]|nr:argininosuccinate lyase [Bacteroidales bacterium]